MSFEVSVPSKVFLLGEYAVLSGTPAWIATLPPRFALREDSSSKWTPHPDSPAGRLIASSAISKSEFLKSLEFDDPQGGVGGLGASTAQFAALYFLNELHQGGNPTAANWRDVWRCYQESQTPQQRGSGADLIAQWIGGICEVEGLASTHTPATRSLSTLWDWSAFLIFSTTQTDPTRKVATHSHLAELRARGGLPQTVVAELAAVLKRAQDALALDSLGRGKSARHLGECLTQYAEILRRNGCESPRTTEDRQILSQFPGVLGVKGCGALQSDTLIVLWDRHGADPKLLPALIAAAKERGLTPLTERLVPERGVTWNWRA